MKTTINKWRKFPPVLYVIKLLKKIKIKNLGNMSLYEIVSIYTAGLINGALSTRAAAVSFSLAMAVFPFSIFLITLLGSVSFLEDTFWELLESIMPPNTYSIVYKYITTEIFSNKDFHLLSVSFLITAVLATNGIHSLIGNLDHTYHNLESRTFYIKYGLSFLLTIILTILLLLTLFGIFELETITIAFRESEFYNEFFGYFLHYSKYAVGFVYLFSSLSMVYMFSIKNNPSFSMILPGASLSCVLILLTSYLFGIYATKFAQYNELYGSIGTVLLLMFWIYLNCIVVIVGFELNATIFVSKRKNIENVEKNIN